MPPNYDLAVIGGGPAGTSAAITAARGGARVLLFERGRLPRHRVCGEFVSAESLALVKTLLDAKQASLLIHALPIPWARVFVDDRVLQTPVDPAAASIARLDLDIALWESAIESGTDARQQITVQQITGNGPFHVSTSEGNFETRSIINASGRWSNLKLQPADGESPSGKWMGAKAHFSEREPATSVDLYFFEGGYCGVQPVHLRDETGQGRINVCAMMRASVATSLQEVFQLHPALRERSTHWRALSEPVSTSPLIFRAPQPVDNNTLLAGDAAGFVDPFVGDGISLALRSGALAGTSLLPFFRGDISLTSALANYRKSYKRRLAPVFRTSSKIRRALLLPRSVRKPVLMFMENIPAITRFLVSKTR